MSDLSAQSTDIPGLLILRLGLKPTEDGWFKESWHRAKMTSLGMPDFDPVQLNVSHVEARGTTRGFLAEPWDRIVSLDAGRAMGAWVDLREGPGYGRNHVLELHPGIAVFVPRGVATAHQTLVDGTTYTYLLESHWTQEGRARSGAVDLYDPALAIPWPIPRSEAILTRRDALKPPLAMATPLQPRRVLLAGAETPLGRSLLTEMPEARGVAIADLAPDAIASVDLSAFDVLVNAYGDTATGLAGGVSTPDDWVDAAERTTRLADVARRHRMRYVHITSDPVFERAVPSHNEDAVLDLTDPRGRAQAAGELVASTLPRVLILRTAWVMGRDEGFVHDLSVAARRGARPSVLDWEHGRLTYTDHLAEALRHLVSLGAASGTYNVTGEGRVVSWLDVARLVYQSYGADPSLIREHPVPHDGGRLPAVLNLDRLKSTDFHPKNAWLDLPERLSGASATPEPSSAPVDRAAVDETPLGHEPALDSARAFSVLFVCTANICRSAYADVTSRARGIHGVEFSSAGTRALVDRPIDPPMAQTIQTDVADASKHRARQLTRRLMEQADLVLTMGADHRRWILDEWPKLGRKTFLLGHAARVMSDLPDHVTLENLVAHLWARRSTDPSDEVQDPYKRGPEAMATAARQIDAAMDVIAPALERIAQR